VRTPQGTVKHLKRNKEIQSVSQFRSGKTGMRVESWYEEMKYKYLIKLGETNKIR